MIDGAARSFYLGFNISNILMSTLFKNKIEKKCLENFHAIVLIVEEDQKFNTY